MTDDHRGLIEEARQKHTMAGGPTGYWCRVCTAPSPWPCLPARLATALEQQLEQASVAQQAAELWERNHNEVRAQRDAAQARAERLAGYADHHLSCRTLDPLAPECDCGLAAALELAEQHANKFEVAYRANLVGLAELDGHRADAESERDAAQARAAELLDHLQQASDEIRELSADRDRVLARAERLAEANTVLTEQLGIYADMTRWQRIDEHDAAGWIFGDADLPWEPAQEGLSAALGLAADPEASRG